MHHEPAVTESVSSAITFERMNRLSSIVQSVYVLFLVVGIPWLLVTLPEQGRDIYGVAALLTLLIAAVFFAVHWWRGWSHMPTLRVVITGCLGAGTLIVLGQWYTDREPDAVPFILSVLNLLFWLHWDQGYNRVRKQPPVEQVHPLPNGKRIVLVLPHKREPSVRPMADQVSQHSEVWIQSDGPLVLPISGGMPLWLGLTGNSTSANLPLALVLDDNGEVIWQSDIRDRREFPSLAFLTRIVEASDRGEIISGGLRS